MFEQKTEISTLIQELKDVYPSKDVEKIKPAMDKLNTTLQSITAELYQKASQQAPPDQEVSDVDFEEVKG